MAKKPVTNRLRILRAEHGITQLEAALATDIGTTRYWKIENDYATATPRERQALRRLFRVTDVEMFPGGGTSSAFRTYRGRFVAPYNHII